MFFPIVYFIEGEEVLYIHSQYLNTVQFQRGGIFSSQLVDVISPLHQIVYGPNSNFILTFGSLSGNARQLDISFDREGTGWNVRALDQLAHGNL